MRNSNSEEFNFQGMDDTYVLPPPHWKVTPRDALSMFWRRKKIIFGVAAFISLMAIVISYELVPKYSASGTIIISPRTEKIIKMDEVLSGLSGDLESVQSETYVLQSRDLAEKVIAQLSLQDDPEFNAMLRPPGNVELIWRSVRDWAIGLLGLAATDDDTSDHAAAVDFVPLWTRRLKENLTSSASPSFQNRLTRLRVS